MVNRPDSSAGTDVAPLPLPRLRAIARHAVPNLVECTLVPTLIFSVVLQLSGLVPASLAALGWSYTMLIRRLVLRIRVPGLLLLTCLGLTVRTVVVVASGSAFIYFLQPIAATTLVGLTFLASSMTKSPMVDRLAKDFCPLTDDIVGRHGVQAALPAPHGHVGRGEPAQRRRDLLAADVAVRRGLRGRQAALGHGSDLERRRHHRHVVAAGGAAGGPARRPDRAACPAAFATPDTYPDGRPRDGLTAVGTAGPGSPFGQPFTRRMPGHAIVDEC